MKKILVLLIFMPLLTFSQEISFAGGFDIANSLIGTKTNSRAVNFQTRFMYETDWKGVYKLEDEVGLFYERFDKLNYEDFGMFFNKVYKHNKKINLTFGVEYGMIHRWKGYLFSLPNTSKTTWFYGFNVEPKYNFHNNLWCSVRFNYKRRTDIGKFVYSSFFNIIYRL